MILHGFSASLRLRYFGPRDLTSDGMYQSSETILLNAEAGYQINKTWRISAEFLNLLDRRDHDIDYAYTCRLTPTAPASGVYGCFPSRRTVSSARRPDGAILIVGEREPNCADGATGKGEKTGGTRPTTPGTAGYDRQARFPAIYMDATGGG